jgi:hypothetical protein
MAGMMTIAVGVAAIRAEKKPNQKAKKDENGT